MYDADLALAVSRQRGAELRAEAARDRLVRAARAADHAPWWRRWRRTAGGRPDRTSTAGAGAPVAGMGPVLRWP